MPKFKFNGIIHEISINEAEVLKDKLDSLIDLERNQAINSFGFNLKESNSYNKLKDILEYEDNFLRLSMVVNLDISTILGAIFPESYITNNIIDEDFKECVSELIRRKLQITSDFRNCDFSLKDYFHSVSYINAQASKSNIDSKINYILKYFEVLIDISKEFNVSVEIVDRKILNLKKIKEL